MKIMWVLAGLCLSLQFGSNAYAGIEFEGFVCQTTNKRPGVRISRTNAPCDEAVFVDSIAHNDYRSLHVGDKINFFGAVYGVPVKVEVEAVYQIGLNRLLQKWVDETGRIFRFYTYSSFTITTPEPNKKFRTLEYELYPNSRNSWMVLLVENNKVRSGYLQYFLDSGEQMFNFCINATKTTPAECVVLQRP